MRPWRPFLSALLTLSMATPAFAAESVTAAIDPLLLNLRPEMVIHLPSVPSSEDHLRLWSQLTPVEKQKFYVRRLLILQRLAQGLSKPKTSTGMVWTKDKIAAVSNFVMEHFAPADLIAHPEIDASQIPEEFGQPGDIDSPEPTTDVAMALVPADLSPEGQEVVETNVMAFVDSLWSKSPQVARATGIGMTFVAAGIFNASVPKFGLLFGRGYSVDLGVNFDDGSGYIRFLYDKQSLAVPALSFDVGPMFDAFLHLITEPEAGFAKGDVVHTTHVKLPIVGCFRFGPEYFAFGAQFGIGVLEMVGAWMATRGSYFSGPAMILFFRIFGFLMVYSSKMDRVILSKTYTPWPYLIRKLGLMKLVPKERDYQQVRVRPTERRSCGAVLQTTIPLLDHAS